MNLKRRPLLLLASLSLILLVTSVAACLLWASYSERWVVGKSPERIEARWGEFDLVYTDPATGHITRAGYVTTSPAVSVFDTGEPDEYFMIWFDDTETSIRAEKHYHIPGG